MTKAQILVALRAKFPMEVVPVAGNPELVETVGDVKKYLYHHLASGVDQNGDPVAHKMYKIFYVYKEGQGGSEAAYYEDSEPTNKIDRKIIATVPATPTPLEIYALYTAEYVRTRVRGLMVSAANDVYNEAPATTNHTQRLKWALDVLKNIDSNLNVMMAFVSTTTNVLAGTWSDTDLKNIVNGNIDKWAVAIYT